MTNYPPASCWNKEASCAQHVRRLFHTIDPGWCPPRLSKAISNESECSTSKGRVGFHPAILRQLAR
eukprot:621-Amphidinium_carterae.1